MLGFLKLLSIGDGTLRRKMHEELEAERLVLVEEGLGATVTYTRFRAPGRRHHGKVVAERAGIGISERRAAVYCRSGRAKLIDTPFDSPRWDAVEVSLDGEDAVAFHVDYSKHAEAARSKVSGEITIRLRTGNARRIADEVNGRLGRRPGARGDRGGVI